DVELEAAQRRRCARLEAALSRLGPLDEQHRQHLELAERAAREAELALAHALVPSLDDADALARTAATLALADLAPAEVRRALDERRTRVAAQLATLEAEVAHADVPSALETARARVVELAAPIGSLRESVRALEADADF